MDKNAIKKFAVWARRDLIERVAQKAAGYGITADEIISADADSIHGALLSDAVKRQRKALITEINEKGYEQVIEEVAYTWFNRLIALRFMEVNGYLPSHIRVFTNDDGAFQPQILSEAINLDPADWEGIDMERIYALKQDNKDEELFKYLLTLQCNALNDVLPEMFEKIDHYTELLLPDYLLREGSVIEQMIALIPEEDWREQVQIIGWLYQYYNTEQNELVYDGSMSRDKVPKELIPAATTIYTPDWAVRYMVENSLGRLWVNGHPDSTVRSEWKYFLGETIQTEEFSDVTEPEKIKFIDPCMGSGHILVYAFDVLMQIYRSCGYTERDAAQNIVQHNLWGIDLSKRAYQLAYFAVMMKARQYDRRFLTRDIQPNLAHCQDWRFVQEELLDEPLLSFVQQFYHADTLGSLLCLQANDKLDAALDTFCGTLATDFSNMQHMIQVYRILSQRYDVVCTNPPYLGANRFVPFLSDYTKEEYPDEKADLSMVMFRHAVDHLAAKDGYVAFITTSSWFFLSSFEKLREYILSNYQIDSIVDYGTELFEGKVGHNPIVSWVLRKTAPYKNITAIRLVDYCYSRRDEKEPEYFQHRNRFFARQENFAKIPGMPVAYWVSSRILDLYEQFPALGSIAAPRKGNSTSDNNRFLRLWYEIDRNKMNLHAYTIDREDSRAKRWYPYNKGGGYRKWYGFNDYLIDWYDDAAEIRQIKTAVIANYQYFMKPGLTWSTLTSGSFSIRWFDEGYIFDNGGCCIFELGEKREFLCALLNSKVFSYIFGQLNPTLNFQSGEVAKFPIIYIGSDTIKQLASDNVRMSREEYDCFETSWDFKRHPLI